MHHVAALNVAVGTTANTAMTAVQDQILAIDSANNFLPQYNMNLIAAYAGSATFNRARLTSPRYRQIASPYIEPGNVSLLPPNLPAVLDLRERPLRVPAYSPLGAEITSDIAMGTEQSFVGLWLQTESRPAPQGDTYTLRATGTTTLTARAWTDVPLTFDQSIVEGEYHVVGGCVYSATGIFWRLIIDDQIWRPGGLAFATRGLRGPDFQYQGKLGSWGRFLNTSMPRLQVYANAADTAETLFLQVVKTR
jgi:hypothetical protein